MAEHQATLNALQPGTRVLLTSGIFATISHTGERHAIIELAPGVEVTMVKSSIARVATDDEEEFELTDEDVLDDDLTETDELGETETPLEESLEDLKFDPRPESSN